MQYLTEAPGLWAVLALALYGFISIGLLFIQRLGQMHRPAVTIPIRFLVLLHNKEKQVEGFVRLLMASLPEEPQIAGQCELVFVDLASTDNTVRILDRLAVEYPCIHLIPLPEPWAASYETGRFLRQDAITAVIDLRGSADAIEMQTAVKAFWKIKEA